MRIAAFVLVGLVLLGICGYLYWITTPLYALQEAGIAAARHDLTAFEKRVDIDAFVDNLIDELLVTPAKTTPDLTSLQRETGNEAVAFAKGTLRGQLINTIRRSIGGFASKEGRFTGYHPSFGADAAIAGNNSDMHDVQGFIRAAGKELGREAGKLKNETYVRLTACARQQPKTITGKLLGSPPQIVGFQAKLLLAEYGFTKDNFKGLAGCETKTDEQGNTSSQAGFKFYSPKAGKEIVVQLGLYKNSYFGDWKVYKIANLPELMMSLNEDYEYQVHSLMTCALHGVTSQAVNDEVRGLTDRIKKNVDTKGLLERFKVRFK
ncbi:MAG: hypothetical protein IT342_10125 [Candidatus Melainabacteria bacterium]|nr:hypothetical protein [Candidatus Melainabacteria bacterium]